MGNGQRNIKPMVIRKPIRKYKGGTNGKKFANDK